MGRLCGDSAMDLIPCPACSNPVSAMAAGCPKCGHPLAAGASRPGDAATAKAAPAAYTPRQPRLRASAGGILFWLLLLVPGVWALTAWLPGEDVANIHSLTDIAVARATGEKYFTPEDMRILKGIAW